MGGFELEVEKVSRDIGGQTIDVFSVYLGIVLGVRVGRRDALDFFIFLMSKSDGS